MALTKQEKPYALVVESHAGQWRWRVLKGDRVTASGPAPNPRLAQGYGTMTTGLIEALARASRRT